MTDFGYEDEFTGVCRAVIDRIAPGTSVIDLTHGIPPGDVRRGAIALAAAIPYSAPSVLLAVVDPGVGTARRAVALSAGDHHLVGPDNGLLWLAAEAAGGVNRAFDISEGPARLEGGRRTFHGRDIFSPVAARLALGDDPAGLGDEIETRSVVRLELPVARIDSGSIEATVLFSDHYGNLILNAGPGLIERSFLRPGVRVRVERVAGKAGSAAGTDAGAAESTGLPETASDADPESSGRAIEVSFGAAFGEVAAGEALLYPDSSGSLSLAVNRGNAAGRFGFGPDDQLRLTPA